MRIFFSHFLEFETSFQKKSGTRIGGIYYLFYLTPSVVNLTIKVITLSK